MLRIAAALGLLTIGCYGYPRGVELAWRATRPVEDSPVGWNHVVMAQARVGLDIAFAVEGAR
jgi:hypothetical protein